MGVSALSMAQSNLSIEYDEAGNRIKRQIIILDANSDGSRFADTLSATPYTDDVISIYPNPTRYFFYLELSEFRDEDIVTIILFDEQGREVLNEKIRRQISKIDLSDQPNGMYFLNVFKNGKSTKWQIVKIG